MNYKGKYNNPKDIKLATLSYDAVADSGFYCSHWFAVRCSANNDITIIENSPLLIEMLTGGRRIFLPEGCKINCSARI